MQINNIIKIITLSAISILLAGGLNAQSPATATISPVKPSLNQPIKPVKPILPATIKPKTEPARQEDTSKDDLLVIADGIVVQADSIELIRGQHAMIWLRDLEKIGWGSVLAGEGGRMIFKNQGVTLSFMKEQDTALVNSLSVRLPIKCYLRDGKLMVPLSFVARSFGFKYETAYRPIAFISSGNNSKLNLKNASWAQGSIVFNGKPVAGASIRLADRQMKPIQGYLSVTDDNGNFIIRNIPDGDFTACALAQDNPGYASKPSDILSFSQAKAFKFKPIMMQKSIKFTKPGVDGNAVSTSDDKLGFEWTPVNEAITYKLIVREKETNKVVSSYVSKDNNAEVVFNDLAENIEYEILVNAFNTEGELIGCISSPSDTFPFRMHRMGAE